MRPTWAVVTLFALLMLTLTGCLQSGIIEDKSKVRKLDDEPVKTVVIWHTYSDEETRVFEEEVIPAFEQANPGIRIQSVRQASNQEYLGALMTRAAADKTPDVIRLDYSWVSRFAGRGLLVPLDPFADYGGVARELRERMLESNRVGEHVYGLPLNITTKAAIFNRRLLDEAGLATTPKSLMEVVELAREQHDVIGMTGIDMWGSLPYFFGLGGKLSDEKFTATNGYLNSEASIYAVKTLLQLYREGVLNPHLLDDKGDLWKDVYSDSRMLMIDEGPWYYSILLNSTNLDVDLMQATVPVPFPSLGMYGSVIGGESLVMTKGTKVKEEAWMFIRWMMRKETQATMFKAGLIPTNAEALRAPNVAGANNPYIEPYLNGLDKAFYRPAIPQWNDIELLYKDAMERIFVEGEDVKKALNEASSAIDALLARQ
ncbi:extracellular solute-binding protein [Cohnella yongneupensis]|uniref:Extracellular solute-binding protein n=1 Tax=Cohnella yongneupensis TaxID=425006 RepID=A0ABW0QV44_9BACL